MTSRPITSRFSLQSLPSQDSIDILMQDVLAGLFSSPRSLPPKYFYDDEGSKLFDDICKTDDYYPTRTERALFVQYAKDVINFAKPKTCIELGAGTSEKTEVLLSELCRGTEKYTLITIDVCEGILQQSARRILNKYQNLQIKSIVGEYLPAVQAIENTESPVLYIFIGSSIGNFTEAESIHLLSEISRNMQAKDYLLLGLDRVKDKKILENAYDDKEGITSNFNLNVLKVLNEKLDANFKLNQFKHQAVYNEQEQQIEMYLVSKQEQDIELKKMKKTLNLTKGEKILTEISRKYTKLSINKLLSASGLLEQAHFEPENEYFSLVLAKLR